jgi:hypothetical protein
MPVVRSIVHDAARNNYKFSSILMGIINSAPFQMRINALPDNDRLAANAAAAN